MLPGIRPERAAMTSPHSKDLWAITCYFNPMRYRRRLANFRIFRQYLEVPLVAVEMAFGPEFELQAHDAEILVQLRGGGMLWQKERLLNLALKALPTGCNKVAWLDCDIMFDRPDWVEAADSLLDRYPMIQLFRQVHNLGPQWGPGKEHASQVQFTRPSAAFSLSSGVPAATCIGHLIDNRIGTCAPGFAWAARREVLDRHLFFDACVIGGGDRAMACAANHCFDELMQRHCMNEHERQCYITWAKPYYETVKAKTGFLDADIFHLWHGDVGKRKGRVRHEDFQRFQFDPYTDVAIEENGAWRWNTDKQEMHEYVRGYFASRREDG
jgi:hypothetical protein